MESLRKPTQTSTFKNQPAHTYMGNFISLHNWEIQVVRTPSALGQSKESSGVTGNLRPSAQSYSQARVLRGVARWPLAAASLQVLNSSRSKKQELSQQLCASSPEKAPHTYFWGHLTTPGLLAVSKPWGGAGGLSKHRKDPVSRGGTAHRRKSHQADQKVTTSH